MQSTEQADKVVGNILEGKVAIIIDNTPFALYVPVTFYEMLQASEDYYGRFMISTAIRWIRFLFLVIALFLPSLYIALLTFHQEMVPSTLLYSVASSRETVPFPAIIEALLMEISFEGLREAGVRLPRPVGYCEYCRSFGDWSGRRSGRYCFRPDGYCCIHYRYRFFYHSQL